METKVSGPCRRIYRLADDIWGIGFRTADRIAEKLGFGHENTSGCGRHPLHAEPALGGRALLCDPDLLLKTGTELCLSKTVFCP